MPDAVPYRIDTPRLTLRCWDLRDARALAEVTVGHQQWFRFAPWAAKIQSIESALAFTRMARGSFDLMREFAFSLWSKSPERLLGGVDLHFANLAARRVTIDYWLRRDATGAGYAREGVTALLDVAVRSAQAARVEIIVAVNNAKSRALPAALGFRKEGVLRKALLVEDHPTDLVMYALLASEYVATPLPIPRERCEPQAAPPTP